jgi:hypothetical protein
MPGTASKSQSGVSTWDDAGDDAVEFEAVFMSVCEPPL